MDSRRENHDRSALRLVAAAKQAGRRYLVLLLVLVALVLLFSYVNPTFLRFSNVMNIVRQTSVLAILAIGMTFVILTEGVDLSVGSNIAFAGAVGAIFATQFESAGLGIVAAVLAGTSIGLINGVMVGVFRISFFISTLATMSLARGLALTLTGAKSIAVHDPVLQWLGQTSIGPFPTVLFLVLILYLVFFRILARSYWGKFTYAVGGNERAARSSGVRTAAIYMGAYMLNGVLVGVGAIVTIGRLSSAQPLAGLGLEFEVITAVVLGGTSLFGGEGGLLGTVLGVAIVSVISNGLGLLDISPFYQYIAKGGILLLAVFFDQLGQTSVFARRQPAGATTDSERTESSTTSPNGTGREQIKQQTGSKRSLRMSGISKAFPGVQALRSVSFDVRAGEVHALVGENGAGKSTLMKILAGVHTKDSGEVEIHGKVVGFSGPRDSQAHGIAVIHQEFSLVSELNVVQNVFLGRELQRLPGILDWKTMERRTKELLARLNVAIDPKLKAKDLTVGQQQMVEIAKALSQDAWLIVMDEPTSALPEHEKEQLFTIIRDLRESGAGIVYISHRMPEIFEIADRVSVLRDGEMVGTSDIASITDDRLVQLMVGREVGHIFTREHATIGEPVLQVKGLTRFGVFSDVSFTVHAGEVLGLSGLMGAGRTEVARSIFGLDPYDSGEMWIDGQPFAPKHSVDAIEAGVALVPEDRARDGIIPLMSVKENLCLPSYLWISKLTWIDESKAERISRRYAQELAIKASSPETRVQTLSGGNQQKVSVGKWLARDPKLLILDEPTRGIDVGAKTEVHSIIEALAKRGIAILMISSELPEVLGISDRIVVLRGGRVTGEFTNEEATQEAVMMKAAYTVGSDAEST